MRVLRLFHGSFLPAAATVVATAMALSACSGRHEGPGQPSAARLPEAVISAAAARQAGHNKPGKQVLFGDLHVHTTFSPDAFTMSLPLVNGEGAHPPADACDFARFCSGLDFWSITAHAAGLTPRHWRETVESIRQCNSLAGDEENPDVVAFLGWEWTQVGLTRDDHYGHKNVILRYTDEERIPARPIAAPSLLLSVFNPDIPLWQQVGMMLKDFPERQRYFDFNFYQRELDEAPRCAQGVDSRELPVDCMETAATPAELFEKLNQWGHEAIVIPHGTTWGLYTPPGTAIDKQLNLDQHDPARQTLFEIFSGHGNSEEHRAWREFGVDTQGNLICPQSTDDYLPCCWQAGEIIRGRGGQASAQECERRVIAARREYLSAGQQGHLTLPGAKAVEWKDCGQCRDCFQPAFNYRPRNSAQYAMALTNFDDPANPLRFRFGFMASSDNHTARPGTGYKEYDRLQMTEATGPKDAFSTRVAAGPDPLPTDEAVPFDFEATTPALARFFEGERGTSFFVTGGLVAVHAEGRSRDSIWESLERREIYGTSGDRILLWFDLLNAPTGVAPMGSEVAMSEAPSFQVRAVGAFEQLSGCPDHSLSALSPARLAHVCRGECYNPSQERYRITRIEVIRIRPQRHPGEDITALIEDPWLSLPCQDSGDGCVVEFSDPQFDASARDTVYYVRAVQEPKPMVNADGLRCTYDEAGRCTQISPCYDGYKDITPEDDCMAMDEPRAWSSPIYLNVARVSGGAGDSAN